jgi:hypothetical protein
MTDDYTTPPARFVEFHPVSQEDEPWYNARKKEKSKMKQLFIAISVMGCAVATAKPHPPKHMPPHARECRACDGRGLVRTWQKMWMGMRQCRKCDGRGYIAPKPPPPPKTHGKRHDSAGKRAPVPPKPHQGKPRKR